MHYGRDALVGVALFLSLLTENNQKVSLLRASYPDYSMSKKKIFLSEGIDADLILKKIASKYSKRNPITVDGVKIAFESSWVHLRKSNTEPIIRLFSEAKSQKEANKLVQNLLKDIEEIV